LGKSQLREVPGLAERMAALMCVDLDRNIETEESDEQDGEKSGSLEHVLQAVETERARVQERGTDSAAWLELEELGIDDDMLVILDLSAKFPNLVALNLWGNRLQDTEKVMQEIRKCPKLKALWLNDNPVLGKGSELNLSFPSVACLSNSFVHTFIAIQGSNRIQIEENC